MTERPTGSPILHLVLRLMRFMLLLCIAGTLLSVGAIFWGILVVQDRSLASLERIEMTGIGILLGLCAVAVWIWRGAGREMKRT